MVSLALDSASYHYHIDERINMTHRDDYFTFRYHDILVIWNDQTLTIISSDRLAMFREGRWLVVHHRRGYYYRDSIVRYRDRLYYRDCDGGGYQHGHLHLRIGSEVTVTYRHYRFIIQNEYSSFHYGSYTLEHCRHHLLALRHPRFYARYRGKGKWEVYSNHQPFRELITVHCSLPLNIHEVIKSIASLL